MDVVCRALASIGVQIGPLIVAILSASSLTFAQDSFMMHYTPSALGASVINRGDFNNDGIPDLITGNNGGTGGDGLSVSLGIGDGRFQNPKNSAPGVGAFDMAVGDFNGDGKLDAALAGANHAGQWRWYVHQGTDYWSSG